MFYNDAKYQSCDCNYEKLYVILLLKFDLRLWFYFNSLFSFWTNFFCTRSYLSRWICSNWFCWCHASLSVYSCLCWLISRLRFWFINVFCGVFRCSLEPSLWRFLRYIRFSVIIISIIAYRSVEFSNTTFSFNQFWTLCNSCLF